MTATARALAAHPNFRWLPGMRVLRADGTVARITDDAEAVVWRREDGWWTTAAQAGPFDDIAPAVVDLEDAATGGVLLVALQQKLRGRLYLNPPDGQCRQWHVGDHRGDAAGHYGKSLGEACALALIAVWGAT